MIRSKFIACVQLFTLVISLLVAGSAVLQAQRAPQPVQQNPAARSKPAAPDTRPALEPKAIDLLKETSNRLAAARSMAFTAVVTYESPSRLGAPLAYATTSDVTMERPNKLRVITTGDGPRSEFYYDGHEMMAFAPAENLAAVATAPPTIDAALKAAYDSAAIYFPFTDLIVADPYKDIADGLKNAFYIGQSRVVGGTTTNMIAYTTGGVFVQMWIGAEDKLPRMLRAIYWDDPSQLRHQLQISDWQIDAPVSAEMFTSSNAANAMPIPFARPDPKVPPGAKVRAKPTPATPPK
jgi:hypothetical protein